MSCPDCRDDEPCPRDVFHQALARAACDAVGHPVPAQTINRALGAGPDHQLDNRRRRQEGARRLDEARPPSTRRLCRLARSRPPGLQPQRRPGILCHRPSRPARTGLLRAAPGPHPRVQPGNPGTTRQGPRVAIVALADLTTDDGYALLDAWLHGPYEEMLGRSSITRTLVLTTPCLSRPPGRERPNRFKW
jgi:hypothetical protein